MDCQSGNQIERNACLNALSQQIARGVTCAWGLACNLRHENGFRILMYHAVDTPIPEDKLGIYTMSKDRFVAQMDFLSNHWRQQLASFGQVVDGNEGVALTFDDGLKDTLTVVAPILSNLAIPFTVFVTPNYVRSGNSIYLTKYELQELASYPGVTIGSHGMSHRKLAECSDTELMSELDGSRAFLEDVLQRPVTCLSYPHGSVDARVERAVERVGYQLAACSRFGTNKAKSSLFRLKRTDIWRQDSVNDFERKLLGHWDWRGAFS